MAGYQWGTMALVGQILQFKQRIAAPFFGGRRDLMGDQFGGHPIRHLPDGLKLRIPSCPALTARVGENARGYDQIVRNDLA